MHGMNLDTMLMLTLLGHVRIICVKTALFEWYMHGVLA